MKLKIHNSMAKFFKRVNYNGFNPHKNYSEEFRMGHFYIYYRTDNDEDLCHIQIENLKQMKYICRTYKGNLIQEKLSLAIQDTIYKDEDGKSLRGDSGMPTTMIEI